MGTDARCSVVQLSLGVSAAAVVPAELTRLRGVADAHITFLAREGGGVSSRSACNIRTRNNKTNSVPRRSANIGIKATACKPSIGEEHTGAALDEAAPPDHSQTMEAASHDAVPVEVMELMNGMMSQLATIQGATTDEERDAQYDVLAGMLAQTEHAAGAAAPTETGVPELPRLFVLGDSISIQYGPFLKLSLQGIFDYSRKGEDADPSDTSIKGQNGGSSSDVLEYLKTLPAKDVDRESWILLNAGLWDVRRHKETGAVKVPLQNYRANVRSMFELARAKGFGHICWVRTTHVDDAVHAARATGDFTRSMADAELYNDVADEVCKECDVTTIDLGPASEGLGAEAFKDHVHFTPEVSGRQGGLIAGVLLAAI